MGKNIFLHNHIKQSDQLEKSQPLTCIIIGNKQDAMLLLEPFFKKTNNLETIIHQEKKSDALHQKLDKYLQYAHPDNKLRINTRTGYLLINVNDIIYCTADGNYTNIIVDKNNKEVATMNIGKTTKLLQNNPQFKRIGRSLLINSNYIYKVDRAKKNCVLEKEGNLFSVDIPDKYLNRLDLV